MKIQNLKTMHKSELAGLIMQAKEEMDSTENVYLVNCLIDKLDILTGELNRRANKQRNKN